MNNKKFNNIQSYIHTLALLIVSFIFLFSIYLYISKTLDNFINLWILLVGIIVAFGWIEEYFRRTKKTV